jgi:uncharacterized membrane protein YjgN (DUF898 family)
MTTADGDGGMMAGTGLAPNEVGLDGRSGATLRLAYRGTGGDLFFVFIKNVFLTLVTLGIYSPWARTARRNYLWRQVEIDGQRLEYTGTGMELFIGYLKVALVYLVIGLIRGGATAVSPKAGTVASFVVGLAVVCIVPFAIYWSRRYLLGRTRWRGIRFGLSGDAGDFAKMFIKGTLLTFVTLGFYAPILNNRVYGVIMNNTRYGNTPFSYDGRDGEAFKISIKGFFLTLLTLGVYFPWYTAAMQRFRLSHTRFAGAQGASTLTGGLLFKVLLLNVLGNTLTLGLAFPWTTTYTLRNLLEQITFAGQIDFALITQQAASGDAAGDLLAGALGVELGV